MEEAHAPNPRAPRRATSAELVDAVRAGRRIGDALRVLGLRAEDPDREDRALALELARLLVRRAEARHEGWGHLRSALQDAGAEAPWARCERQAIGPTAERVLADCATPGRTPLLRIQHAAAQELARALAPHVNPQVVLPRLFKVPPAVPDEDAWERALVAAVNARSQKRAAGLLGAALSR